MVISTSDAKYLIGCGMSVVVTACLVVSNKSVLERLRANPKLHAAGPSLLLLLHRSAAFFMTALPRCKSGWPDLKHVPLTWQWIAVLCLASNLSIVCGFLALQQGTVAFYQLSRLALLPLSTAVDVVAYGKRRTAMEYGSLVLLSYAVASAVRGDVGATPGALFFSGLSIVLTMLSNALSGHFMKHVAPGSAVQEFMLLQLPYEILAAGLQVMASVAIRATQTPAHSAITDVSDARGLEFDPTLCLETVVNALLAPAVMYLSSWTVRECSNLVYAVLGQGKMLLSIVLGAMVFRTTISARMCLGVAVGIAVPSALTLTDLQRKSTDAPKSARLGLIAKVLLALSLSAVVGDTVVTHVPRVKALVGAPSHLTERGRAPGEVVPAARGVPGAEHLGTKQRRPTKPPRAAANHTHVRKQSMLDSKPSQAAANRTNAHARQHAHRLRSKRSS